MKLCRLDTWPGVTINETIAIGRCVYEVHSPHHRRFAHRSCRRRRCLYRRHRDRNYGRRCTIVTIVRRRFRHLGIVISSCVCIPRSSRRVRPHARVRRCLHPFLRLCVCMECLVRVVSRGRNHPRPLCLAI